MKRHLYRFSPKVLRSLYQRIEASPLGYRLAKGAFWSMVGQFASRGLSLVALVVTARILGKFQFGQLGMVQSTVGMFASLAGFGMGLTATKHVAELRKTDPLRAGRIIGLSSLTAWITGGVLALALIVFAPALASRTMAAPELANPLRLGAALLLFGAVNGAQNGALSGLDAFKGIARVSILSAVACFPMSVLGAYFWGLKGAVAALVLTQAVLCLMTFLEVKAQAKGQGFAPTYSGALSEFHVLWRFSLPTMLCSLAQSPVGWLTNTILVNQSGGYGELGIYNAALRIKGLPDSLVGPFLSPILPALSEKRAVGDWASCKRIYSHAVALISLVVIPFCLVLMAAPFLTFLPYGKQFYGEPALVRWLMLHGILSAICGPLGFIFVISGRMWLTLGLSLLQATVQVLLAFVCVPSLKGTGLAVALAGAFAAQAIVSVYFAMRDAPQILANRALASTVVLTAFLLCASWISGVLFGHYCALAAGIGVAFIFIILLSRKLLGRNTVTNQ